MGGTQREARGRAGGEHQHNPLLHCEPCQLFWCVSSMQLVPTCVLFVIIFCFPLSHWPSSPRLPYSSCSFSFPSSFLLSSFLLSSASLSPPFSVLHFLILLISARPPAFLLLSFPGYTACSSPDLLPAHCIWQPASRNGPSWHARSTTVLPRRLPTCLSSICATTTASCSSRYRKHVVALFPAPSQFQSLHCLHVEGAGPWS